MELEEPNFEFKPIRDPRPLIPEPPPVRLVAVEDVQAKAIAGLETHMDDFYSGLLKFEREQSPSGALVYKAENFRLRFTVIETPAAREDFRPIAMDVPALQSLALQLVDREIEYQWQRGLMPGSDSLLLQDPTGNWVQIGEVRQL